MKKYKRLAVLLLTAAVVLGGCSGTGGQDEIFDAESADQTKEQSAVESGVVNWDEAAATLVALNGDSITVDGAGAAANGGILTISAAGTYVLSGSLTAGQILVEAPKDATVRLVLNGVDITAGENAAIYNPDAGTLIVTLADGAENTISDAADFAYAQAADEEPDAAIFSKNNLTIEGGGSLTVNAGYNNGIGAKDDLLITGGVLHITAANHGLRGRDSVTIEDGDITITAGNDGIQSNNDEGEDVGWIRLEGGHFAITAAHDGVQAESALTIGGGDFHIVTGGGAAADLPETTGTDTSDSYKGLKAGASIAITGGSFLIDSADDAIHTNGDIRIDDGVFAITTGDDAVHADGDLTINDGTIDISASYEGLEAFTMTIASGTINIVASDDGVNVAGGADGESQERGPFGADSFAMNGDRWLKITGGHITIDSGGDGIDINGNGEMTAGEVYINARVDGPDSALDYDGSFVMTGGIIVGAGSSQMAMSPGSDSTQPALMLYYTDRQAAGTTFELIDSDGRSIVGYTPAKDYQNILVSVPALENGEAYTVLSGGEKLVDITLSGVVTSISDTGEAVTGGGHGGPGGGRGGMGGGPRGGQLPDGGTGDRQPPDDAAPAGTQQSAANTTS